jgi:hypothetical protein
MAGPGIQSSPSPKETSKQAAFMVFLEHLAYNSFSPEYAQSLSLRIFMLFTKNLHLSCLTSSLIDLVMESPVVQKQCKEMAFLGSFSFHVLKSNML